MAQQPNTSSSNYLFSHCDQSAPAPLGCWQEYWSRWPVDPSEWYGEDVESGHGFLSHLLFYPLVGLAVLLVGLGILSPFFVIYVYCWRVYTWGWRGLFTPLFFTCVDCHRGGSFEFDAPR